MSTAKYIIKEGLLFTLKAVSMTLLATAVSGLATHIVDFAFGTNYATADNIGLMALVTVAIYYGFTGLYEMAEGDEA